MNEFLVGILEWIRGGVGSWGWAMVVFTILVRLVLTPLDYKSRVSMRKTQKLQPQLAALQKKYANDKEKLNSKTAELYKKEHINPLSSCLPLLLSWPILIAMFSAMRYVSNRELLQQLTHLLNNEMPELERWLWIRNLWMPDTPFAPALPELSNLRVIPADQWQNWFRTLDSANLPVLLQSLETPLTLASFDSGALSGTIQQIFELIQQNTAYVEAVAVRPGWTFNLLITQFSLINVYNGLLILPILSAVSQVVMTKVLGGNQQQANDAAGAGTGKFMQYFFPIFSLFICLSSSASFALYWVAGNLASMIQSIVINKILDNKEKAAAVVAGEGTVR